MIASEGVNVCFGGSRCVLHRERCVLFWSRLQPYGPLIQSSGNPLALVCNYYVYIVASALEGFEAMVFLVSLKLEYFCFYFQFVRYIYSPDLILTEHYK